MIEYRTTLKDIEMSPIKNIVPQDALMKSERLVSAIYLLTGFFADNEPLKWSLRTLGADLLSKEVSGNVSQVKGVIMEVTSLLRVAKNAGLISEMNEEIIEKEFDSLSELLEPTYLLNKFFDVEEKKAGIDAPKDNVEYKGQIREELPEPKPRQLKAPVTVSQKKNGRQMTIINLLKRKKEIMIKDVSPLITGCSEKTIQRELLSLVKAGVLRKIGEKRWSRYSLA